MQERKPRSNSDSPRPGRRQGRAKGATTSPLAKSNRDLNQSPLEELLKILHIQTPNDYVTRSKNESLLYNPGYATILSKFDTIGKVTSLASNRPPSPIATPSSGESNGREGLSTIKGRKRTSSRQSDFEAVLPADCNNNIGREERRTKEEISKCNHQQQLGSATRSSGKNTTWISSDGDLEKLDNRSRGDVQAWGDQDDEQTEYGDIKYINDCNDYQNSQPRHWESILRKDLVSYHNSKHRRTVADKFGNWGEHCQRRSGIFRCILDSGSVWPSSSGLHFDHNHDSRDRRRNSQNLSDCSHTESRRRSSSAEADATGCGQRRSLSCSGLIESSRLHSSHHLNAPREGMSSISAHHQPHGSRNWSAKYPSSFHDHELGSPGQGKEFAASSDREDRRTPSALPSDHIDHQRNFRILRCNSYSKHEKSSQDVTVSSEGHKRQSSRNLDNRNEVDPQSARIVISGKHKETSQRDERQRHSLRRLNSQKNRRWSQQEQRRRNIERCLSSDSSSASSYHRQSCTYNRLHDHNCDRCSRAHGSIVIGRPKRGQEQYQNDCGERPNLFREGHRISCHSRRSDNDRKNPKKMGEQSSWQHHMRSRKCKEWRKGEKSDTLIYHLSNPIGSRPRVASTRDSSRNVRSDGESFHGSPITSSPRNRRTSAAILETKRLQKVQGVVEHCHGQHVGSVRRQLDGFQSSRSRLSSESLSSLPQCEAIIAGARHDKGNGMCSVDKGSVFEKRYLSGSNLDSKEFFEDSLMSFDVSHQRLEEPVIVGKMSGVFLSRNGVEIPIGNQNEGEKDKQADSIAVQVEKIIPNETCKEALRHDEVSIELSRDVTRESTYDKYVESVLDCGELDNNETAPEDLKWEGTEINAIPLLDNESKLAIPSGGYRGLKKTVAKLDNILMQFARQQDCNGKQSPYSSKKKGIIEGEKSGPPSWIMIRTKSMSRESNDLLQWSHSCSDTDISELSCSENEQTLQNVSRNKAKRSRSLIVSRKYKSSQSRTRKIEKISSDSKLSPSKGRKRANNQQEKEFEPKRNRSLSLSRKTNLKSKSLKNAMKIRREDGTSPSKASARRVSRSRSRKGRKCDMLPNNAKA